MITIKLFSSIAEEEELQSVMRETGYFCYFHVFIWGRFQSGHRSTHSRCFPGSFRYVTHTYHHVFTQSVSIELCSNQLQKLFHLSQAFFFFSTVITTELLTRLCWLMWILWGFQIKSAPVCRTFSTLRSKIGSRVGQFGPFRLKIQSLRCPTHQATGQKLRSQTFSIKDGMTKYLRCL